MIYKLSNTEKILLLKLDLHKCFPSTATVEPRNLAFPTINLERQAFTSGRPLKVVRQRNPHHSCVKVTSTNFILAFPYYEAGY